MRACILVVGEVFVLPPSQTFVDLFPPLPPRVCCRSPQPLWPALALSRPAREGGERLRLEGGERPRGGPDEVCRLHSPDTGEDSWGQFLTYKFVLMKLGEYISLRIHFVPSKISPPCVFCSLFICGLNCAACLPLRGKAVPLPREGVAGLLRHPGRERARGWVGPTDGAEEKKEGGGRGKKVE